MNDELFKYRSLKGTILYLHICYLKNGEPVYTLGKNKENALIKFPEGYYIKNRVFGGPIVVKRT